MRNYKLVLVLIVLFFDGCAFASAPEKLPPTPMINWSRFDLNDIPVSLYRVFKVPVENYSIAETMLGNNKYYSVNDQNLKKLFPKYSFNLAASLKREVSDAEEHAKEHEEFSAIKHNYRDFLEVAKAFREYANYTKTLKPPFHPYLVKAKVYAEGTGAFSISLKKNILDVYHGSLSQQELPEHYVYIVVFVEREIDSVEVNAGYSS